MGKEPEINVLQLETALEWRGGQRQIAYLVQGLLKAGIKTTLVCPPEAKIRAHFMENNLPVFPVKIRHGFHLKAAHIIARYAKENHFTVLHAHSSHALSLGLLIKMLYPSIQLIASRRVDFSVKKPIVGPLKYNNHWVNRIICISDNIAQVMRKDGVKSQKLEVIHSGVSLERMPTGKREALRKELGIPGDHFVVGTVAALVGHKDYPTLLQAAKEVLRKSSNVTFIAVGEGHDREQLETLHRTMQLGAQFRFVGFQADVHNFLVSFDLFVLASRKEGLGTSVLDAMVYGLPVVATKAGGIPEMVVHGHNGLLVEPEAPHQLASAILRLLNDSNLRQRLAENARESVRAFSFERMVEKHIALYRALSAKKRRRNAVKPFSSN